MTSEEPSSLSALIDDALWMRKTSSYKCFGSNVAAQELQDHGKVAFEKIATRLATHSDSELDEMPGTNSVLQAFMVLGNQHCPDELAQFLTSMSPSILAATLGQGSLALVEQPLSASLRNAVEGFTSHPDRDVIRWAGELLGAYSTRKQFQAEQVVAVQQATRGDSKSP